MKKNVILSEQEIRSKIYTIRDTQVMLDEDLARLYNVETRVLNQAVKRNPERFPQNFMIQLNEMEYKNLISQSVTSSSKWGGRRKLPYVFTEQGIAMLSAVLKSETAVKVSIKIIEAFVAMRKFLLTNAQLFQRMDRSEQKLLEHDNKFKQSHDRFIIIDNKEVYHLGASLKDLGKKWFAFSKFDKEAFMLLDKLK